MSKKLSKFSGLFKSKIDNAIELVRAVELARLESQARVPKSSRLYPTRIELVYELAYLKMFYHWESVQEEVFIRYLCGYAVRSGNIALVPGMNYYSNLAAAQIAALNGKDFLLWHNPNTVVNRSARYFVSSPMATVIFSNMNRLEHLSAIRHRIVHAQSDARLKFDTATMTLTGRRYRGSRVGLFLRDLDVHSNPPKRWLERLGDELVGLVSQIV